jgi:outer membrane protein OmpA-like peptidoglycan-associated protein
MAGVAVAGLVFDATPLSAAASAKRSTLAITYPEGTSTTVDLVGSGPRTGALGSADVKRKQGRTRVQLRMEKLQHPQSLGSLYTTYVVWAVAPEGQAENLAELPHSKDINVDFTTSSQTFGLIVTAEPHSAVRLPSPVVVAENAARPDTKGRLQTGRIEYGGAVADLYAAASPSDVVRRDFKTPLLVQSARNAVELARQAGASRHAEKELREAEVRLAALEQASQGRKLPREFESMARDVMRMAENARMLAEERSEQARLAAERSASSARVARAQSEAERARMEAEKERARADSETKQAAAARTTAEIERERAEAARTEAERARAGEEVARAQADSARREADEARRAQEEAQRQLQTSLSAILETRREARGLIVNMSDVLFDFNRATLTPGAREKLSKLAGVMLAYPGSYRISTEGHTDSVGTDEYNMKLSRDRAESVLNYVLQAGIPSARVGSAVGFGESRPVASNDSASGRQMNRRVEIVISELDH